MFDVNNINLYSTIFQDEKKAVEYLLESNTFHTVIRCSCQTEDENLSMIKSRSSRYREGICFRCFKTGCRRRKSIKSETIFQSFKKPLHIQLMMSYCWILNMSNYQTVDTCQINEQTYTAFKDSLISVIADEIENRFELIIGPRLVIQVYETAVCRGRVIIDPSNTLDSILNTTWLVGGIEEKAKIYF
ncbi:hypothetical protein DMUE_1435 [Dictyocoela muelleri]|nr:hypothetical protein DMUE_1435 [Dictyocoela muelleri]